MPENKVTRTDFLKAKFPIVPYCDYSRGYPTKYMESIHFFNDRGLTLNFFWRSYAGIAVESHNSNEPDEWKKTKTISDNLEGFCSELILKICTDFFNQEEK